MSESNFNADDPNPDDLDEQSSRPDGVDAYEDDDFDPAALPPYLNEGASGAEPEPETDPSPETGDEGTPAPSPEPSAETPQPPVVESNGPRYASPDGGVTNTGSESQVFGRPTGDNPVETASSLPPVSNVFSNDAPETPQIQQEVPQPTADTSRPADNLNPSNINFSSFPKGGDVPKDLAAEVQSLQSSPPPQAKLLGGDQFQQSGDIAKIESAVQELTATVARLTEALSDIEMV